MQNHQTIDHILITGMQNHKNIHWYTEMCCVFCTVCCVKLQLSTEHTLAYTMVHSGYTFKHGGPRLQINSVIIYLPDNIWYIWWYIWQYIWWYICIWRYIKISLLYYGCDSLYTVHHAPTSCAHDLEEDGATFRHQKPSTEPLDRYAAFSCQPSVAMASLHKKCSKSCL